MANNFVLRGGASDLPGLAPSGPDQFDVLIPDCWDSDQFDVLIPDCWDSDQWVTFSSNYPWLFPSKGWFGCSTCRDISNLGVLTSQGESISKEWSSGTVTSHGNSKSEKLLYLWRKTHRYKTSDAHKRQIKIKRELEAVVVEQQRQLFASTTKVFRTVYSCAKLNRPYTDFSAITELQVANDVDVGCILHNEKTAECQSDDVTGSRAYQVISRTMRAAEKMKDTPGKHVKETLEAIKVGSVKGVQMTVNQSHRATRMNLRQFYRNLSNNLRSRLYVMSTSHNSSIATLT
ncbi:UNVERIFIED_CONTAM: hypothetical protein FKN15_015810 [Acipenser sinensis]